MAIDVWDALVGFASGSGLTALVSHFLSKSAKHEEEARVAQREETQPRDDYFRTTQLNLMNESIAVLTQMHKDTLDLQMRSMVLRTVNENRSVENENKMIRGFLAAYTSLNRMGADLGERLRYEKGFIPDDFERLFWKVIVANNHLQQATIFNYAKLKGNVDPASLPTMEADYSDENLATHNFHVAWSTLVDAYNDWLKPAKRSRASSPRSVQ